MKRKKTSSKPTKKKSQITPLNAESPAPSSTRREFLAKARNWSLLALVVGGGGWLAVNDVRATMQERDLSRIGNGIPTIVQIHDPQCPLCTALQREARDAMEGFETHQMQFLVADIMGQEGRQLAAANGVGHVTLLLFDGEGRRREILRGSNTSEVLKTIFQKHYDRYGKG